MTPRLSMLRALTAMAATVLLPSSISWAQAAPEACAGEILTTSFGQFCKSHVDLPAITEWDYGVMRLHFSPPASLDDVIPESAVSGSFLRRLGQSIAGQRVNSAAVLLEVRAQGNGLPAADSPDGVLLGVTPLAVYSFDNREGVKFNAMQQFADRPLGPTFLLQRGQVVRVRVRVVFSHENASSLLATLRTVTEIAAGFGGHGWFVSAVRNEPLMENLTSLERTLTSVNNLQAESDAWVDMDYERNWNRLVYNIQLNPRPRRGRAAAPPRGQLVLTLERRPSLFTDAVFPGSAPGRALPNYGVGGAYDIQATGRIWTDGYVGPGVTPSRYVEQDPILSAAVPSFQNTITPVAEFEQNCRRMRTILGNFNLSPHDREAIFWAAFASGNSAREYAFREAPCIKDNSRRWTDYGFGLPAVGAPPPPAPSREDLEDWIERYAAPALREQDPQRRTRGLRNLFRDQVRVNVEPNTIYDAGDEPPLNSDVPSSMLVTDLKPMQAVGCLFNDPEVAEDLHQFKLLGRHDGRLLTLTVDYGGRARGARVEVTGLRIAPVGEADWAALEAQNAPPACRRENAAYAPLDPPANPANAGTVTPP